METGRAFLSACRGLHSRCMAVPCAAETRRCPHRESKAGHRIASVPGHMKHTIDEVLRCSDCGNGPRPWRHGALTAYDQAFQQARNDSNCVCDLQAPST